MDQTVLEQGLGADAVHPGLKRFLQLVFPTVAGQQNDGCFAAVDCTQFPGKGNAVHDGHDAVRQHQLIGLPFIPLFPDHPQGFLAALGGIRLNAHGIRHQLLMLPGHRVVVHYQGAQPGWDQSGMILVDAAFGHLQGDRDGEGSAHAFFAFHRDFAVHHGNDALGDRHAQARAAVFVAGAVVFLGECLKDFGDKFFAHAHAGIPDDEAEHAVVLKALDLLHAERDRTGGGGEFYGVS